MTFHFFSQFLNSVFGKLGKFHATYYPTGTRYPTYYPTGITRRVSAIPEPEPDPTLRYPHPPETRLFATRCITNLDAQCSFGIIIR